MPIHLRPSFWAAAMAVPHPQNGSSTRSPGLLLAWMMRSRRAMGAGLGKGFPDIRFQIENLVAEGDAVVARFTMEGTHTGSLMGEPPTGEKISARGLTYYGLANGQIVEDDPLTTPNLVELLGIPMPAQPGS
jgi:SnoaL-like polyketide cyclase